MSMSSYGMSGGAPAPAAGDPFAVARMLVDPDAYRIKLNELEMARSQAEAMIALVGSAQEIPQLHADAVAAKEQAEAILDAARVSSTKQIEETEAYAVEIKAQADADRATAAAELIAAKEDAKQIVGEARAMSKKTGAALLERENAVKAREDAVAAVIAQADEKAAAADAASAEAEKAKARYDGLIQAIADLTKGQ